jgi:hypothetical protein
MLVCFVSTSKQKKTEIKLDINLLSKTNKYKTKQTNQKYKKEKKNPIGDLMGERFKLPTPHLSFTALFITWMMYSAFIK